MLMTRRNASLLGLVALLALAASAGAAQRVTFHADAVSGTTLAVLETHGGEAIASPTVAGSVPYTERATGLPLVPTRLLALLRDDAAAQPGGRAAEAWLRGLLGDLADAPSSAVSSREMTTVLAGETSNWCGTLVDGDRRCPTDCKPSDDPKTCSGCGCAGSAIIGVGTEGGLIRSAGRP
jgi:hypothetical protein